ncbi:uncharacterized protein LOC107875318 isoform X1 [Capsicum annuum]|uniref:uncharacterized protein LOC107875318 isoform X1 n=1 Tax=Capsicum annuum TaxID=4072 RepID=UPI001FB15DD9|nr:uncharacterized protein LOC107875318 isoform X1 [Capsicum annuum]
MRRRFKSAVKSPPKTLNSSAGGFNDDDRFDVIKEKKVTSPDNEADPLPNAGRVALSKKYRTARNPNCKIVLFLTIPFYYYPCPNQFIISEDVNCFIFIPLNSVRNNSIVSAADTPKTSEYAFFKKLKKNIGPSNPDLLHRGSKLPKISQPSNCISDTTSIYNVLKYPNKDLKIPIQAEKKYQSNECLSFSPVDGVIVHQNAGISKETKLKYFSLPTAVTRVDSDLQLSPLAGPSNHSGTQYSGNGIFAAKRQKLCQRANELFLNVEKLNSERFDLVSALLKRLFPGRKEDEGFWDSQVRKGENASTSSLAYAKPDHANSRPLSRHIEDVTAPEYRMSEDDCCPSNFFGRPEERVTPELDDFTSSFHPIGFDLEAGLHYEDADNSQISNNKITINLWDQSDSSPSLSFERHGLADHFLPDRLHSAYVPVSRGAQNYFLDWDFNEEDNDPVLAISTIRGNKLYSPIATSRQVDYQQSTEKKLDALALCSSSLFTNSEYSDVQPYFCSTSFQQKFFPTDVCSKDFGMILEHEDYAVARMDRFDLPLLCYSEEQGLLEYCNTEDPFASGTAIVPYLSHHEKNHCDSDALLPMALDTFGWKFLSATSSPLQRGLSTYQSLRLPHREDTIGLTQEEIKNSLYSLNPRELAPQSVDHALNTDIWFSCNSEVSCDKAGGRSLLLANASWITSVEEISPDHCDEWTWS